MKKKKETRKKGMLCRPEHINIKTENCDDRFGLTPTPVCPFLDESRVRNSVAEGKFSRLELMSIDSIAIEPKCLRLVADF